MKAAPVVGPIPDSTLKPAESAPGAFVNAINADPNALLYFLLNVGDGDTQLLVLPPDSNDHRRRVVIVDIATPNKLPALLEALHGVSINGSPLIETPGTKGQIRLLVATHPHFDHIGGMSDLLARYNGPGSAAAIDEFWDPGFFLPTPSFHNVMTALETSPWIRRLQPTSGTSLTLDATKLTVMGPGIGLRSRFDTYGVQINDSSITLMVDYPANHIFSEQPRGRGGRQSRRTTSGRSSRLLLGGDAQFTSWAQTTVDFPDLEQEQNATLAKELRSALGRDYLAADLMKISHHASKHGVTLELLERVGAPISLISSVAGGGKYGFPHLLGVEAIRESRQAIAAHPEPRKSDQQLGIHVTGAKVDTGQVAGSIAAIVPRHGGARVRLFRFGDRPRAAIDLKKAREVA